jgi:hypothetical protein
MVNIGKSSRYFVITAAALCAIVASAGCPVEVGDSCASSRDCCEHSPSSLCTEDGYCESNYLCAEDPTCYGSRFGVCEALPASGALSGLPPPASDKPGADSAPITWGGRPCTPGESGHAICGS